MALAEMRVRKKHSGEAVESAAASLAFDGWQVIELSRIPGAGACQHARGATGTEKRPSVHNLFGSILGPGLTLLILPLKAITTNCTGTIIHQR